MTRVDSKFRRCPVVREQVRKTAYEVIANGPDRLRTKEHDDDSAAKCADYRQGGISKPCLIGKVVD